MTVTGSTLAVSGPIWPGDGARFDSVVSRAAINHTPIRTVTLDSPGGVVGEGMRMADIIREQHLDVAVPDDAMCASACFMLLAAGSHKVVGRDARIGIHSATSTATQGPDDGAATMTMARYVAQLGVPEALVGRMIITDSVNLSWLSPSELRSMGAVVRNNTVRGPSFYSWISGDGAAAGDNEWAKPDAVHAPNTSLSPPARRTTYNSPQPAE